MGREENGIKKPRLWLLPFQMSRDGEIFFMESFFLGSFFLFLVTLLSSSSHFAGSSFGFLSSVFQGKQRKCRLRWAEVQIRKVWSTLTRSLSSSLNFCLFLSLIFLSKAQSFISFIKSFIHLKAMVIFNSSCLTFSLSCSKLQLLITKCTLFD